MQKLIDSGDWGHSTFQAFLDLNAEYNEIKTNITGVAAVCFDENDNVVLMNNEPLGGHIEPGENIEEALKREALEEGGMQLDKWKYFGLYNIAQKEAASEELKIKYPKTACILFFLAKGKKVMEPYGTDVKSSQILSKQQALMSNEIKHMLLIEGIKLYPEYLN